MGLRARKCKPFLGKVTKKPGLLKGTGEKTMSPSSKFLAITICHLNNALEYKPPSFKPLPPLKYLRFDPKSLPSLVCSMSCAWDLRIFCFAMFQHSSLFLRGSGWQRNRGSTLALHVRHVRMRLFMHT